MLFMHLATRSDTPETLLTISSLRLLYCVLLHYIALQDRIGLAMVSMVV